MPFLQVQAGGGQLAPPGAGASTKERIAYVHWQLDQFDDKKLLLGRFQSLGPAARRQGGTPFLPLPDILLYILLRPALHVLALQWRA